jgi:hypothetical protein
LRSAGAERPTELTFTWGRRQRNRDGPDGGSRERRGRLASESGTGAPFLARFDRTDPGTRNAPQSWDESRHSRSPVESSESDRESCPTSVVVRAVEGRANRCQVRSVRGGIPHGSRFSRTGGLCAPTRVRPRANPSPMAESGTGSAGEPCLLGADRAFVIRRVADGTSPQRGSCGSASRGGGGPGRLKRPAGSRA